jgi:hypothetical protein
MNSNVKPSIIKIERNNLKEFMTETKETLARDVNLHQPVRAKKFGIIDLWNCQRMMKTAISRRRF